MAKNSFLKLLKRRGFAETLEILNDFPQQEAIQSEFFDKMVNSSSYPNVFFRVKTDLLKHHIIAYKLNQTNEKVIFMTDKGKEIWRLIQDIETLLVSANAE